MRDNYLKSRRFKVCARGADSTGCWKVVFLGSLGAFGLV